MKVSFKEAFRFWLKLGFISFGGPTGQIAIMHQELVERRKWISEARFLHALNYCMLLPGPEATQLAIYIGWLLHKTRGGITAGVLFILPAVFVLWVLSYIYVMFGQVAWVASIFYGLKPAVVAIVASALIRIGTRALKNEVMWTVAMLAFVAIYFYKVPFPLIIVAAGIVGLAGGKIWREKFLVIDDQKGRGGAGDETVISDETEALAHTKPSLRRALRICATWLAVWWAPVLLAAAALGWKHVVAQEGVFFSKASLVTFGGAYAVLPYVSQQAVEHYHWLEPGQMLDGLALAETTPGPLIMVLQYVGFMGGWKFHGNLPPIESATLGALITTWTTFAPCFLWVFLGGPHIEQLRGSVKLTTALSTITAAVVGVILNLTVWFGMQTLFPGRGKVDWFAVVVSVAAFIGILKWKWSIIPVVIGGGLAGLIYRLMP